MGAWGKDILENDLSADIYDEFMEMYDDGLELKEIHQELLEANQQVIEKYWVDIGVDFWLGLAQAEWDCGYKNDKTIQEVKKILENKDKLDDWQLSRIDVIAKFLKSLETPVAKPRERHERIPEQPVYSEGTCLAIKILHSDYYGAAIVLRNFSHHDNFYIDTLIGGLRGVNKDIPKMDVF